MNHKIFDTPRTLANQVALDLANLIDTKSGTFNLAISGGSTPLLLFEILAHDFAETVNWQKLHVFWVDERCVPPTHPESNYGAALERWFSKVALPEQNIHRMHGESVPETEAIRYQAELSKHLPQKNNLPVFDLILLGMGDDGHTASIFPPQLALMTSEKSVAVGQNPYSGQNRITLTGTAINNAENIWFLVTGQNKAPLVNTIFNQQNGYLQFPAAHISPTNGDLVWFLDKLAASELE